MTLRADYYFTFLCSNIVEISWIASNICVNTSLRIEIKVLTAAAHRHTLIGSQIDAQPWPTNDIFTFLACCIVLGTGGACWWIRDTFRSNRIVMSVVLTWVAHSFS